MSIIDAENIRKTNDICLDKARPQSLNHLGPEQDKSQGQSVYSMVRYNIWGKD